MQSSTENIKMGAVVPPIADGPSQENQAQRAASRSLNRIRVLTTLSIAFNIVFAIFVSFGKQLYNTLCCPLFPANPGQILHLFHPGNR